MALAATPALPAAATTPTPRPVVSVELGETATLSARGAVVLVPLTVTCAPGEAFADVVVSITQRRRLLVIRGSGVETDLPCTGRPESMEVAVTPARLPLPFQVGIAFAEAELFVVYGEGEEPIAVTDRDRGEIVIERG